MSNDLISRRALKAELTQMAVNGAKRHVRAYARCINALELAPAVDTAHKGGCEWCQPNQDGEYTMLEFENPNSPAQRATVSFCDGTFAAELDIDSRQKPARMSAQINYCPFCGRKMNGCGHTEA